MSDKIFVDTNVLLYLLSNDLEKKSIAKEILKSNHHISIQVLNEFSNVSLKKFQLSIDDRNSKKNIRKDNCISF